MALELRRSRARWRHVLPLLFGLGLSTAPAAAWAAGPTPAMREAARHLMDEGRERTARGDLPRALEAFESAHELMHVPTTGLAVARTHVALHHLVEARAVAADVAKTSPEEGEHPAFADARAKAKELESELGDRIPKLRIVLRGANAASLTIDDRELPAPFPVEPILLNPGAHVIVASDGRGVPVREEVSLAERESKTIELALGGLDGPKHGEDRPRDVSIGDTQMVRTDFAKGLTYGGFGLAVVGLGVGAVTGAMTFSAASAVEARCESGICDPAAKADLDRGNTLATVSTIGFVAMGAGVVLGIVGLSLPKKEVARSSSWGALTIDLGVTGVKGAF